MATQQISRHTVVSKVTTTKTTIKRKPGRPKGSKDSKPRKTRSDKGKSRSVYAGKPTRSA